MNVRLITPWKRANSSQYWFRMVVPPRYRSAVGKTEVKQSLGTEDLGEARRQCATRQADWIRQFATIDCEIRLREAQQCK